MDNEVIFTHHNVTIQGVHSHVATAGAGNPLILVHGLGGPLMWQRFAPLMAQHFCVIVPDLPGFGDSDPPPRAYTTEDHARHLIGVIDALQVRDPVLVGISYGGQVVLTFAHFFPARFDRIVLVASTGLARSLFLNPHSFTWRLVRPAVRCVLRSEWLMCRMGARSFFDISNRPAGLCHEFYIQLSAAGKREAWVRCLNNAYAERKNIEQYARELKVPALLVWGEDDRTVRVKHARAFHRRIAGSVMVTYAECAHSVPLEKPELLCNDIVEFIEGT